MPLKKLFLQKIIQKYIIHRKMMIQQNQKVNSKNYPKSIRQNQKTINLTRVGYFPMITKLLSANSFLNLKVLIKLKIKQSKMNQGQLLILAQQDVDNQHKAQTKYIQSITKHSKSITKNTAVRVRRKEGHFSNNRRIIRLRKKLKNSKNGK